MGDFYPNKISALVKIASLSWWIYVVIILALFFSALVLNYIVKKINEARLENRFTNLRTKASSNHSTQVLEIDKIPTMPSQNTAGTPNLGISLVFNKEDNLLEDKRRKYEPSNNDKSGVIKINSSDGASRNGENNSISAKDEEMNKSAFLGTIYKELYEKRDAIARARSLSNADHDSILSEIVDKMVTKIKESKSTPSIKKLQDIQNEKDLKEWTLDLVKKKDTAPASSSGYCK